jgi:uncharacterized small protein (DUF1192 family)
MLIEKYWGRSTTVEAWGMALVLVLSVVGGRAIGDGQAMQSDDFSPAKIDAANSTLLQKTVDEQQREIASLRAEIAALKAQLRSMGLTPTTDATTQPVASKVKRIIFIYAQMTPDVDVEIHKAVAALDGDQWFNAYLVWGNQVHPFKPEFVQATDHYKKEFQDAFHLPGFYTFDHSLMAGLSIAAQFHPDLIWVVGPPEIRASEDSFISDFHKRLPGLHARIDTAVDFMQHNEGDIHFLWRLAHETGGVCVDKDGNPMDEPPLPLSPPAPPPPPQPQQTPTILRDKP